jgi:hypothetical protein
MARKDEMDEKPALSVDDKFELLIGALATNKGITKDDLAEILSGTALLSADAMKKSLKPENDAHPGKSCFAYAEGDVEKPRPTLPFEFFYNAYPWHKFPETQHWRELELACQVQPGAYTVIRRDGTPMPVEVKGDRDVTGKLTSLRVEFVVSRDEKALIPPQSVLLYQLLHNDNPRKAFVEAMTEYFQVVMGGEPVAV